LARLYMGVYICTKTSDKAFGLVVSGDSMVGENITEATSWL